ncbi:hypothetical protein [Streptomyces sp. NPDC048516]|uniref:hypothetical protein n=1 Tax=Streptomyces sp. NPDC048516 TaxID=3365565 RepID=UPI0037110C6E
MTMRNLALLLLYCLVVVPAGIVASLGRDPLRRAVDRAARTYWIAAGGGRNSTRA